MKEDYQKVVFNWSRGILQFYKPKKNYPLSEIIGRLESERRRDGRSFYDFIFILRKNTMVALTDIPVE